jgi:hypothetical protein
VFSTGGFREIYPGSLEQINNAHSTQPTGYEGYMYSYVGGALATGAWLVNGDSNGIFRATQRITIVSYSGVPDAGKYMELSSICRSTGPTHTLTHEKAFWNSSASIINLNLQANLDNMSIAAHVRLFAR